MSIGLFIPHLGYLKHFGHLITASLESDQKLYIFYYQNKESNQSYINTNNLNLIFLHDKDLIPSPKERQFFNLINQLKNFAYWNLDDFSEFTEMKDRFRIRPSLIYGHNKKTQSLIALILKMISSQNSSKVTQLVSEELENFNIKKGKFGKILHLYQIRTLILSPYLDGDWQPIAANAICQNQNITTLGCMASWDNFENKGIASPSPDYFLCWTEYHKSILENYHKIPFNRIITVGSYIFDNWFKLDFEQRRPAVESEVTRIVYLCSSPFITGAIEKDIIRKFVEMLGKIKSKKFEITIRPHPQNHLNLENFELLASNQNVAVNIQFHPVGGSQTQDSRKALALEFKNYDLAVGVNTSMMLESCALDMPVTLLNASEFGFKVPKTRHIEFLKKFVIAEFNNENQLNIFFSNLNKSKLNNLGKLKKEQLYKELFQANNNFQINFSNQVDYLTENAIRKDGKNSQSSFLIKKSKFRSVKRANLKRGLMILRKQGISSFFYHLRLFIDNSTVFWSTDAVEKFKVESFVSKSNQRFDILHAEPLNLKFENDAQYEKYVEEFIAELVDKIRQYRKVYIGPWFSELGFELLYLIPFFNYVKSTRLNSSNFTVISRGGKIPIYDKLGFDYVNPLEYFEASEWETINNQNWKLLGGLKQSKLTSIDKDILESIFYNEPTESRTNLVLHPSLIFALFRPFWLSNVGINSVLKYLKFPIINSELGSNNKIFVKLYSRPSMSGATFDVDDLIEDLSGLQNKEIYLCASQEYRDDHTIFKYKLQGNTNLHEFHADSFADNLRVQLLQMIRCSKSLVTYGGLSYFPLFYGLSSIGLYEDESKFAECHLLVAKHLAKLSGSTFEVLKVSDFKQNGIGYLK